MCAAGAYILSLVIYNIDNKLGGAMTMDWIGIMFAALTAIFYLLGYICDFL